MVYNSVGLSTTSAIIKSGKCVLHGVQIVTDGTNAGTVIIYDNTAASGTVLYKAVLPGATRFASTMDIDVAASNGLYLAITGTGAEAVVYFR